MVKGLLAALLVVSLSGCAETVKIALEPSMDDAAIYVDGERVGSGRTLLDVGYEHGWPKSLDVEVKADGYKTLHQTISNQPDYQFAGLNFGVLLGLGALGILMYATDPKNNTYNGAAGALAILISPVSFFDSNKFKKAYHLDLEKASADKP